MGERRTSATPRVAVTVLVDNAIQAARSQDGVKRFEGEPLLAEHGFSALVELGDNGRRILWDAGSTSIPLTENTRRMGIDLSSIGCVALSHGHYDHVGAVTDVVRAAVQRPHARRWRPDTAVETLAASATAEPLPIVAHPAAFRERWSVGEDGTHAGPRLPPPRAEWEALGAQVVLSEAPYELAPGCWTTGMVPRRSFEQAGRSRRARFREGTTFLVDDIEDDQAIAIRIRGKGVAVLAGCAHAGIINTVNYAREVTGEEHVIAVLGGFHLVSASEDEIERTIDEMQRIGPDLVSPSHCTGFRAICRLAERMPDQFVLGTVGTTFLL